MTYLNYFQFDDDPFLNTGEPKYKFRIKKQWKVFKKILDICYVDHKVSFVYGKEGVGKTFVANELKKILEKSKSVTMYNSKSSKNLEETIKNSLKKSNSIGKKLVFIIDEYEDLLKTEKDFLEKNISDKFLKKNNLNIVIFSKEPIGYIWERDKLTKTRFKISSMGMFEGYSYTNYMIEKSKSLNSWRKRFPKWFVLLISAMSNGRVKFVNRLASEAIKNAYKKKRHRASVRGLLGYFSEDTRILRTNLSERFKQLFIIITSFFLLIEMHSIMKDKLYKQKVFNITQEIDSEFNLEEEINQEIEKIEKIEKKKTAKKSPVKKIIKKEVVKRTATRKQISETNGDVYVLVQSGDSFGKIAKEMKLSSNKLKELNGQISNVGNISIGQKIYIKRNSTIDKIKKEEE
ncbi:MAG: LysM peptidoglycan-binding domain-containing protein [Alphaproteobacteria bacterium]|jgi:LysM repeat protein|nr:LysM peptidoglycan-binding domain-containing protein [Alphaproteobacteria bacterium]